MAQICLTSWKLMVFGQKPEIKRYHTKNLALDSVRGRIGGFAGKG